MAEGNKQWYVLRAISGKEAKVKEVLDAAIKNTDLGKYVSQVLIPTEPVYVQRNGKKVLKERTLYSGYVFIEAQLSTNCVTPPMSLTFCADAPRTPLRRHSARAR